MLTKSIIFPATMSAAAANYSGEDTPEAEVDCNCPVQYCSDASVATNKTEYGECDCDGVCPVYKTLCSGMEYVTCPYGVEPEVLEECKTEQLLKEILRKSERNIIMLMLMELPSQLPSQNRKQKNQS